MMSPALLQRFVRQNLPVRKSDAAAIDLDHAHNLFPLAIVNVNLAGTAAEAATHGVIDRLSLSIRAGVSRFHTGRFESGPRAAEFFRGNDFDDLDGRELRAIGVAIP